MTCKIGGCANRIVTRVGERTSCRRVVYAAPVRVTRGVSACVQCGAAYVRATQRTRVRWLRVDEVVQAIDQGCVDLAVPARRRCNDAGGPPDRVRLARVSAGTLQRHHGITAPRAGGAAVRLSARCDACANADRSEVSGLQVRGLRRSDHAACVQGASCSRVVTASASRVAERSSSLSRCVAASSGRRRMKPPRRVRRAASSTLPPATARGARVPGGSDR